MDEAIKRALGNDERAIFEEICSRRVLGMGVFTYPQALSNLQSQRICERLEKLGLIQKYRIEWTTREPDA